MNVETVRMVKHGQLAERTVNRVHSLRIIERLYIYLDGRSQAWGRVGMLA
jgi:hypothetical protein